MQIRGADSRLIKESTVDRTQRLITFDELEKPMKELGSGEFCVALLSKLDGKDVVVKMLKLRQRKNPTASEDLLSESTLLMAMRHPHVLGAIAHGLDPDGLPFIVIEKLETVLSAELPRPADSVPFWTRRSEVKKWPLTRALRTGLELAEALHYCHTEVATSVFPGCRILHRDLKPNNIGFLPDGRLALFDFGLARLWRVSEADPDGNETRKLTGNTGSLRYMAPEVALAKPYSHKAEVFSFGTLLWQIASHENPFADCDVSGFIRRVCTLHERPKIPKRFPPELAELLTRCWKTDQAERPEMAEVIVILRNLLAQLESSAAK
jgi:serine/threonine protein kinase